MGIDNGQITVSKMLDREQQSTHSLNITVKDHGQIPLISTTSLEIILDDG